MKQKIFLSLLMALMLQGCVVAVGGAAIGAAGTAMVYDRRNVQSLMLDEKISHQILTQLQNEEDIKTQCHVAVAVYRQIVLIAGQAPNQGLKDQISDIAKSAAPKARRIYNEMTIEGPTSALTRTSDSWITTKVKTKFLATKNLASGQFKVVTEDGTVFLMGIVDRNQADIAVDIARHTDGVQKVVKIFEYKR
ncbi:MAG: BON domain-containing protein [Gammaproteobacteria bacterium]|nr:BON domain-containing protein [Gammaproteobacteria bacterium]